jgi:hypothetical protein
MGRCMSITEDLIKLFNDHSSNGNGLDPERILEIHGQDLWDDVEKVAEEFIEEHRWYNLYLYVYYVKAEGRYVGVHAEMGSTENQEHDTGDAFEVKPKEITTITYVEV